MLEATHVVVDIKHIEATQAIHHHLEKVLEDVHYTNKVLGKAIHSQQHMDPIIRESADAKEQSAAHSTASLGQADNTPCLLKCSLIMKADKNFNLMVCQCFKNQLDSTEGKKDGEESLLLAHRLLMDLF